MEDTASVNNNVLPFKEGLLKARSHIVFILGLLVAFGIVIALESWEDPKRAAMHPAGAAKPFELQRTMNFSLAAPAPLTDEELQRAKIAWKYFENNYQPETGLVNSVENFSSTTMWDSGSYLMALISAYRLNIIDKKEFDERTKKILSTLAALPLVDGKLPNKAYSTKALRMSDYNNQPSEKGIGWSAIDIARIIIPLNIIAWNYPEYSSDVKKIFSQWKLEELTRNGSLYGAEAADGKLSKWQEGRFGYEEYAAKPLAQIGLDVVNSARYDENFRIVKVGNVEVPADARDPKKFGAQNYVLSEPYILEGLEYGLNDISKELAYRVYKAQEERYNETGTLTAVTEDHVDREPWFVYSTVYSGGEAWRVLSPSGKDFPDLRTLSTKAAFGWDALFRTDYTKKLVDKVKNLYDPQRGWYAGVYENSQSVNKSLTCNTNAVVLEALAYKKSGPAFRLVQ